MKIQDLSIADYKVLSTDFDESKLMIISISGSCEIKQGKVYGITKIYLRNWIDFSIKIYKSYEPFGDVQEILLDTKKLETFEYIQEVEMVDNRLFLRGFSNKDGQWLIYEFKNPIIDIELP